MFVVADPTRGQCLNVYCPDPPGGTIVYPSGQQKKLLPFAHGRDLLSFNGTDNGLIYDLYL